MKAVQRLREPWTQCRTVLNGLIVLPALFILYNLDARVQAAPPPHSVEKLLAEYCTALGSEKLDQYRSVFHRNGHPEKGIQERLWKEHDTKHAISKAELLFQDDKLMVVRLSTEIVFKDYKPPLLMVEVSLVTLQLEDSAWKVWSVTQLDVNKKE